MTTEHHRARGPGLNAVWTPRQRQVAFDLAKQGLSGSEIGRRMGVTKNAVIGQLHRHHPLSLTKKRPGPKPGPKKDKETAKSVGSAVFVGPSEPRRFSWEEGA